MLPHEPKRRLLMVLIFLVSLFAVITQLLLMVKTNQQAGIPVGYTVGNYFSYFTVLSNSLIVMATGWPIMFPKTKAGQFFLKPAVISAIAVYIFIVSLVYNLVLRGLVPLKGLNILCDELLHVVDPVMFVSYWFFFVSARSLQWKMIISWLIFPAVYLIYTLVRGSFTHWYPYPFLNVDNIGLSKVTINSLVVLSAFIITGSIAILLKRRH